MKTLILFFITFAFPTMAIGEIKCDKVRRFPKQFDQGYCDNARADLNPKSNPTFSDKCFPVSVCKQMLVSFEQAACLKAPACERYKALLKAELDRAAYLKDGLTNSQSPLRGPEEFRSGKRGGTASAGIDGSGYLQRSITESDECISDARASIADNCGSQKGQTESITEDSHTQTTK